MRRIQVILLSLILILLVRGTVAAGGPFGPPQPVFDGPGRLHTAVGVWHQENLYGTDGEYLFRQNQVYSEAGYGAGNRWEIYARIGVADLNVREAFSPVAPGLSTSHSDFEENWRFFGALGARGFYPFGETFGIGAFIQGNYTFSDFHDQVSGSRGGTPFALELRVKGLYDVNLGFALQAKAPFGTRIYCGPFLTYSEALLSPSADVPGFRFAAGETTIRNRTPLGGFAGIDAKLAKGFRLNVEGQYADRLSAGVAVLYLY